MGGCGLIYIASGGGAVGAGLTVMGVASRAHGWGCGFSGRAWPAVPRVWRRRTAPLSPRRRDDDVTGRRRPRWRRGRASGAEAATGPGAGSGTGGGAGTGTGWAMAAAAAR